MVNKQEEFDLSKLADEYQRRAIEAIRNLPDSETVMFPPEEYLPMTEAERKQEQVDRIHKYFGTSPEIIKMREDFFSKPVISTQTPFPPSPKEKPSINPAVTPQQEE